MDAIDMPTGDIREMLQNSLRGFLSEHWRASAEKDGAPAQQIAAIWGKLVGQGVAALGSDPTEGGLREIAVVMAELGRAGCPAPMWSVALSNLALFGSSAEAAAGLLAKVHG